jgi:hypothetical protein
MSSALVGASKSSCTKRNALEVEPDNGEKLWDYLIQQGVKEQLKHKNAIRFEIFN